MVYVISKDNKPLMPTDRHGKVRRLLKDDKAIVVKRSPFTIKLLYDTTDHTQDITLGVDAGSKRMSLSAVTDTKEIYAAEIDLRSDITKLLAVKRELRRTRRNRLRYRKPRFNNRVKSKHKGWLAPSVRQRIDCHLQLIANLHKILPITKIIVEIAAFDIQKIKNPDISGVEYQQGEQMGFWNIREYVLFRDGHECQCCKGKSGDNVLNVHHIESRQTGGDAPNNLITLCETCHTNYHKGILSLPKSIKRGMSFRDVTFMGIMRWFLYNALKETYTDVSLTYGYITKNTRIHNNLVKAPCVDARCITGKPTVLPLSYYYKQRKVRCHNRQIHKANILKNGIKRLNQAPYIVNGYRLFDKVRYQHKEYFIFGRRSTGCFDIRDLSGNKVNKGSISCKYLQLIERTKHYLTERRIRQDMCLQTM